MSETKILDTIEELNSISFFKCEDVRIGDVLYYACRNRILEKDSVTKIGAIKRILRFMFFSNAHFDVLGSPNTLFLISNVFRKRRDHNENFLRIVKLSNNYVFMFFSNRFILTCKGLFFLRELMKWNKQMTPIIKEFGDRLYYIGYMYEAYMEYVFFDSYCKKNGLMIENLITLCDVQLTESFFTQKFNAQNKRTITLQHGTMCSTMNEWTFLGSRSDYFIANSNFTLMESSIVGFRNKMLVAGVISSVMNQQRRKKHRRNNRVIGLMIDADCFRIDNYRAISTVVSYCDTYDKKIKVKLHPLCDRETYLKEFAKVGIIEFYGSEITVERFCDMIDIAIVRNSTTLIEAIQYGTPTYIINDSFQSADVYRNVDMLKFSDVKELYHLLDERPYDRIYDDYLKAREYFGCFDNVTERYTQIFRELGIL